MVSCLRQRTRDGFALKTRLGIVITVCFAIVAILAILAGNRSRLRTDLMRRNGPAWAAASAVRFGDPSLLRYGLLPIDSEAQCFANLASGKSHFQFSEAPNASPNTCTAHVPGLAALQLDQYPMDSAVFPAGDGFTAEAWIRWHGAGSIVGANDANASTLMALGSGVHDGFAVMLQRPAGVLSIQLGQQQLLGSVVAVSLTRVAPEVWTHVATSWDGRQVRLYVNGLLSSLAVWDRQFLEARSHSRFRIGYTGNGAGALRFDLGEAAVFTRALPAADVWKLAMRPVAEQRHTVMAAREALAKGDTRQTFELLEQLSDEGPLAQEKLFTLGEAYRELQNWDQSLLFFQRLTADSHESPLRDAAAYEEAALLAGDRRPAVFQKRSLLSMDAVSVAEVNASPESVTWVRKHLRERQLSARDERLKTEFTQTVEPLLSQHCYGCHSSSLWQQLSKEDLLKVASVWKPVEAALQSGTMPPQDAEALDVKHRRAILHWIRELPEQQDCSEQLHADGRRQLLAYVPVGRRLNRGEFVYSINDLLGVQPRLDLLPPSEGAGGEGFDTAAGTLIMSSSTAESFFASVDDAVTQWKLNRQQLIRPDDDIKFPADSLYHASLSDTDTLPVELKRFLRRAWRKTPSDEDLRRLVDMFNAVIAEGLSSADAIAEVLAAVLLSPQFLYLLEEVPEQSALTRISQSELAARMAFFLWSSVPDEDLMNVVELGGLKDEEILSQADRMLADERATRLGTRFGLQWLGIDQLERIIRDADQYPDYSLRTADLMKQEAARFVSAILCDDRPLEELFTSDYVWSNKELAGFHGLEWQGGTEWAQLTTSEKPVAGILTLTAVLATNSYPTRTSPVLRGRWILDRILGQSVLPAPADVPALEQTEAGHPDLTLRQQMEQHRSNPNCRACHQLMDPLGFSLEEFDSVGRFRRAEKGQTIDVAAVLPDGTKIEGVAGLRQAVLARRRQWLLHLGRKLTGFAIGRELFAGEHCLLVEIVDRTEASGGTSRALIHSILLSDLFQQRRQLPTPGP